MTKTERNLVVAMRKRDPNRSISECYWNAKRSIHFRETLAATNRAYKKRSKAAKKAWKTRRANAR